MGYTSYICAFVTGFILLLGAFLLFQEEPKECLTAYVVITHPMDPNVSAVVGDMQLCGNDLEVGNIKGPSQEYRKGNPL